ncbi:ornithine carbamoyltransferase [Clostridium sp. YIM B02515]|uniref:Ornithine carbamoyltransferase n=1 Tax=Clostridium rhizosphaerae TaxID=2803861 RepID=A0ABS1TFU5_9CLOT|nr:ornithine carbamoyltransferase [Clostridium rhizosphaerae]MBL4938263.1 ornithine carbamoyltransferase [Clostridium rhizosphaerae]
MNTSFRGKHFITCQDWSRDDLDMVFEVAKYLKMKHALNEPSNLLKDKTAFLMFFEESTRTRNSMEAGITQLGGHAHFIDTSTMQINHGESPKDTAEVLSSFGDAICVRNCFYGIGNEYLRTLAKYSKVPILSLQDDVYHPMQVLADMMTIQERFGNPRKLKVAISWAYATSHAKPLSVPQSQILLFARYGMDVTVAAPKEFPLMPDIVDTAYENADLNGGSLKFVDNMEEAFRDADIVIPKNWGGFLGVDNPTTSEGKTQMKANLEKYKDWICDEKLMSITKKHSIYMHALPADRGREVVDSVIDGRHSIVIPEAENRIHTAKAIMALTMGGR